MIEGRESGKRIGNRVGGKIEKMGEGGKIERGIIKRKRKYKIF